jgi:hypothetical protein
LALPVILEALLAAVVSRFGYIRTRGIIRPLLGGRRADRREKVDQVAVWMAEQERAVAADIVVGA